MRVMSNTELIGKRILSQDGREIGEVESLHVDVETWRLSAVGVKLRREVLEQLSLKRPLIGTQVIRIPIDQVSGASDTVVLKPTFAKLAAVTGETEELKAEKTDDDKAKAEPAKDEKKSEEPKGG
jgi:sporulation protein YlmC with PRC-barrel domain